jgi:D-aminoacyl-tRNA deacylase
LPSYIVFDSYILTVMRVVIQRVKFATVRIDGNISTSIKEGLLVLLGIEHEDTNEDTGWLAAKIARLRIFDDNNGIMNLDVSQAGGQILVISQFTLHAQTRKGNRPSYIRAATPGTAIPLYNRFIDDLSRESGKEIKTGEFGAEMEVELVNSGPVTIIIDSKNKE